MSKHNPNNAGRKLFDGKDPKEVLPKLEQSALIDAPVREMCYYADISESAYYRYMEKHPKFRDRIQSLRERLTLKSRQNIAAQIESGDIGLSKWMLERRSPEQFAEKIKLEHSGSVSGDGVPVEDQQATSEYLTKLKENRIKRSLEQAKQDGEL